MKSAWSGPEIEWIQSTLRLIANEARELRAGGETVITRLADILVKTRASRAHSAHTFHVREEILMQASIHVITLGVADLQRSMSFYRDGLGLPTEGLTGQQFEDGAVVFFHMKGGLILALFPTDSLERDSRVTLRPQRTGATSIGQLVRSKQEVDDVMRQAKAAGGTITDPPHDRVWGGYTGYFQGPDGHLWEIVWNPHVTVAD